MSRIDLVPTDVIINAHNSLTLFCLFWFLVVGKKGIRTSPNPEIPTQDRRASFDGCEGANPPLAVGRIPETFHAVPYCAADALKREGG